MLSAAKEVLGGLICPRETRAERTRTHVGAQPARDAPASEVRAKSAGRIQSGLPCELEPAACVYTALYTALDCVFNPLPAFEN